MEESEWGEFESAPLDETLVALIEQALSDVHPNARARCDVDTIHRAFRTLVSHREASLSRHLVAILKKCVDSPDRSITIHGFARACRFEEAVTSLTTN